MLLNGESLRRLGIVQEAMPSSYRAASYELTVGTLLMSNGDAVYEHAIPPQGMVKVVSNEYVKMPVNCVGYVLVKTSLCNRGILALNIGVVDPLYEGHLSSTLINFGKRKQRIRKGDVFSRLTVHHLEDGVGQLTPTVVPKEKALADALEQVDNHLGDTFLDLRKTSDEAAKKAFGRYKLVMLAALPGLAVLLAGLTFLISPICGRSMRIRNHKIPSERSSLRLSWTQG